MGKFRDRMESEGDISAIRPRSPRPRSVSDMNAVSLAGTRRSGRTVAELCLRLQRGSGIRRWALRAAGRGTRGGGARGEER
jgi:hypothetical protein